MKISDLHSHEQAILATITYFSLFHFPLRENELQQYLLKYDLGSEQIKSIVKNLKLLSLQGEYVCLKGEEETRARREGNEEQIQQNWRKVFRFIPLLRHVPFVRGVFVCNNLSFNIQKQNSDIDLFIVTVKDHIFLTRFLVTLLLHLLGVRRHGKRIKNRFCLSFYASEEALNFENIALRPNDIYLAYWTLGLTPIIGQNVYEKILEENEKWLTEYFHRATIKEKWKRKRVPKRKQSPFQKLQESFWRTKPGKVLEKKIADFQKKKIRKSYEELKDKSGTIISDEMLKFHDHDQRANYQKRWEKKIRQLVE